MSTNQNTEPVKETKEKFLTVNKEYAIIDRTRFDKLVMNKVRVDMFEACIREHGQAIDGLTEKIITQTETQNKKIKALEDEIQKLSSIVSWFKEVRYK